jgi:hypothetical protein
MLIALSACATRSYQYTSTKSFPIRERAITQTQEQIAISASVPGSEEAEAIFGIPIYKRGIQAVWLEIVNNSQKRVRFAPTALDPEYFSPLEVAYMHRNGFTKEARAQMDRRLYFSSMPRQIPAGETRSGYVYTHASPGTKSFNIDLFSEDSLYSFAFFIDVPGFVPDHAAVDFDNLYESGEVFDYTLSDLREGLAKIPFTTSDQTGEKPGLPVGLVLVGSGTDLLKALLRAGWHESPKVQDPDQLAKAHYLFGRMPDAVFRIQRTSEKDRNELLLWLAPLRIDGELIWLAQANHFIGQRTQLEQVIFGARFDPNIDEGRDYFMQNIWYSQSMEQMGWIAINEAISIENTQLDFNEAEYFTDGYVNVIWMSGSPISLLKTRRIDWDAPPFTQ